MDSHEQELLLTIAERSIRHTLATGERWRPRPEEYPDSLAEPGASFVTLQRSGNLRGCIGTLEALRPLLFDVAHNAHAAAFEDPRFPPLRGSELEGLDLHISLLTPPQPLHFSTEEELLSMIRPGVDGLILSDGVRRGTFLPSVWEQLPTVSQFLQHLKLKAGLPPDHWSDTIRVERYTSEIFGKILHQ